jgi:hypothetical protein
MGVYGEAGEEAVQLSHNAFKSLSIHVREAI